MGRYKNTKGFPKRLSVTATAVVVIIFIILYIFDSVFGLGNKDIVSECEFHFLDVGQGDCTMVISDNAVVVVDAGPGDHAESTLTYIKRYTDTIDYLILTHPHEDHIGGADELIGSVKVENVIMSDASTDTLTFKNLIDVLEAENVNVIEAKAGDSYTAEDISFTILAPISEFTDHNDYSIVTRIAYGDTAAVVTGDVEKHSEGLIVDEYGRKGLRAELYKVAHHGSYTSNSSEFLKCISPEYAVITCGEGNEYGHPHKDTVKKLKDMRVEYYRTDEEGTIVFGSDGKYVRRLDQ